MIDVEFLDTQVDYNIILGHSYIYTMKADVSSVFCIMIFLFNGKVVTLDQLNYYDPHASTNPENILPKVGEANPTPYVNISLDVYNILIL